MITVYKYDLLLDDTARLQMPSGAELLHVGEQHGQMRVWARVDTDKPLTERLLRVVGTGHPDAEGVFVSTVITRGSMLVWHVFDLGEEQGIVS